MTDKKSEDEQNPDDQQPESEEVVSDFDGVRLRSSFRIVEEAPGQLSFSIEGPVFDLDEEDPELEEENQ